jgi:hypothetical protein
VDSRFSELRQDTRLDMTLSRDKTGHCSKLSRKGKAGKGIDQKEGI